MFHDLPKSVADCMERLQVLDAQHRRAKLPAHESLCAVPPETGRFLAILAAAAPAGKVLEIGTSGGYSTLWLTLAARGRNGRVLSFERSAAKLAVARDTFAQAGVSSLVDIRAGDVREFLPDCRDVAFCFMDHEKTQYIDCYEMLVPNLVSGGIIAADNVQSHAETLAPFVAHVTADIRVDAVVVPIGKGVLLARKN